MPFDARIKAFPSNGLVDSLPSAQVMGMYLCSMELGSNILGSPVMWKEAPKSMIHVSSWAVEAVKAQDGC